MLSKSYSNKSENNFISVCDVFFKNIENELIAHPAKYTGINDYKRMRNIGIFSERAEKDMVKQTIKFFNGVLGAISDEIYDGNRRDYKHFITNSFKNTIPMGGVLVKSFFKDNKSTNAYFQDGRNWGKEFYLRYQNNDLAKEQPLTPQQKRNETAKERYKKDQERRERMYRDFKKKKEQMRREKKKYLEERREKEEEKARKEIEINFEENRKTDTKIAFAIFIPLFLFVILMNLLN